MMKQIKDRSLLMNAVLICQAFKTQVHLILYIKYLVSGFQLKFCSLNVFLCLSKLGLKMEFFYFKDCFTEYEQFKKTLNPVFLHKMLTCTTRGTKISKVCMSSLTQCCRLL